jgi:SAM-dependent methyltransferase
MTIIMSQPLSARSEADTTRYDEEYFERGSIRGISGYMNYSWLPELTLRMAHHLVRQLGITRNTRVLDYGCAKGYLVKALRILDIDARGVDVSEYALACLPSDVRQHCSRIHGADERNGFEDHYEWMIAKDVFEHISEANLRTLLAQALPSVDRMFLAIPLGLDDQDSGFVIAEYDKDITHITARTAAWWRSLFEQCGWRVDLFDHQFFGIKENWTLVHPHGNAFFVISAPRTSRFSVQQS